MKERDNETDKKTNTQTPGEMKILRIYPRFIVMINRS